MNKTIISTTNAQPPLAPTRKPSGRRYGLSLRSDWLDPVTMQMVEGIDAQIVRVFDNMKVVAEAAGGSLADVVKLNIYLTDLGNFTKSMNDGQVLLRALPGAAAVGVASLPRGRW